MNKQWPKQWSMAAENLRLRAEIDRLRAENERLTHRVAYLEDLSKLFMKERDVLALKLVGPDNRTLHQTTPLDLNMKPGNT